MVLRTIRDLFNKRYFEIPKYQRSYSWERTHVRELFEDIRESMETRSDHYIGTIVLSKSGSDGKRFFVVDGQQRLVTLMLIISEITHRFLKTRPEDYQFYRRFYIKDQEYKMSLLGKDQTYLENLLEGKIENPKNRGQRRLKDAYEEIGVQLDQHHKDLHDLLDCIERLTLMELIEESEGDAIRIFQTVNDRGKPLSNMERAKALLIYYSNRYLSKSLDSKINDIFGEIFELYDDIKVIAEEQKIPLISRADFSEDNILQYHFVCFSDENYDATPSYVLDFLKRKLTYLRSSNNLREMEDFINQYADDLLRFFRALRSVLEKTRTSPKYYGIFCILNLSATLYPLTVKLEQFGILDDVVPGLITPRGDTCTFIDLIELLDVRVYKTRGTDPRAEISRFVYSLKNGVEKETIRDWILAFNRRWMPSGEFESRMKGNVYGNAALKYIFIDYCEYLENKKFTKEELQKFNSESPQIEHIISQHPNFSVEAYGFRDEKEFADMEHRLGNLTLLEERLNSSLRNKSPLDKVKGYATSIFRVTRDLSAEISAKRWFGRKEIEDRTEKIWEYLSARWWCKDNSQSQRRT